MSSFKSLGTVACLSVLFLTAIPQLTRAATWFVTPTGAGTQTGDSWANAAATVQSALNSSVAGDQVWVEQGTYTAGFTMVGGVNVYGGFVGTESSLSQLPANPETNPTVLSGVSGVAVNGPTTSFANATLTGLIIRGCGQAVYNDNQLTLDYCIVSNSLATQFPGSAVLNDKLGTLIIHHSIFRNNTNVHASPYTASNGGAIFSYGKITATGCEFTNNYSPMGGDINIDAQALTLTNCTFASNRTISIANSTGGSIYCVFGLATLTNCRFTGYYASSTGGAIGCSQAELVIHNCSFKSCATNASSNGAGGAVFCSGTFLTVDDGSSFTNNSTGGGGGAVAVTYDPYQGTGNSETISDTTFSGNSTFGGPGGAFYAGGCGHIVISDCLFKNNAASSSAGNGGGISCVSSDSTVSTANCTFTGNTAAANGGGLYFSKGATTATATVKDCLIAGNTAATDGGGIYVDNNPSSILNNTLADNSAAAGDFGGGISVVDSGTGVTIANNIVGLNTTGIATDTTSMPALVNNDVYCTTSGNEYVGLAPGPHDIQKSPRFVNHLSIPYDYRLLASSPCINTGDNAYVMPGDRDLDGNARIFDGVVDMGAYEFSASFTIAPDSVNAGQSATGTVTLETESSTPTKVYLSSGNTSVQVPTSLIIPAGSMSKSFPIQTSAITSTESVTITATMHDGALRSQLTVLAP